MDVGGTLGSTQGRTLTSILVEASPLPKREVHEILRNVLHVSPSLSEPVIARVCDLLRIERDSFPSGYVSPPLTLFPGALAALERLNSCAPVVTLSNVCCADVDGHTLQSLTAPHVAAHYPSCEIGFSKPDRRTFDWVAAQHGVSVEDVLHVGDNWECDVRGALFAGARAIWLSLGRAVPGDEAAKSPRLAVVEDLEAAVEHVLSTYDIREVR